MDTKLSSSKKRVIALAEPTSWIKIDRNILEWRWFKSNPVTLQVFLYLLLKANVKPGNFGTTRVLRGQLVTSISRISSDLDITAQQVRTAINHLKATGEITSRTTSKYSVITIVNYSKYQGDSTSRPTGKQQANNKRSTGNQQQSKNNKKEEKEKEYIPKAWELEIPKQAWGRFGSESEWDIWKEANIDEVSAWVTN